MFTRMHVQVHVQNMHTDCENDDVCATACGVLSFRVLQSPNILTSRTKVLDIFLNFRNNLISMFTECNWLCSLSSPDSPPPRFHWVFFKSFSIYLSLCICFSLSHVPFFFVSPLLRVQWIKKMYLVLLARDED